MGVKAVAAGVTVYLGTGGSNRYIRDRKTKLFWVYCTSVKILTQ